MSGKNIVPHSDPARNGQPITRKIINWFNHRRAAEAKREQRQQLIDEMVADNSRRIARIRAALTEGQR